MWDVVVVGARAAGAATAMLLARQGAEVLAVDRAHFPSDTLSTHQIQPAGVAMLDRWGLLEALERHGTPGTAHVRFDIGGTVVEGCFPDGGRLYSPRRTVLDKLLVDAARDAGAEVLEGFHVAELLTDGDRVTGIRGRDGSTHRAGLVVGADGKHSLVAKTVRARTIAEHPSWTVASYSYWEGVDVPHGELYHRPGRAVAAFPTNDGLTMVYACAPRDEFDTWRKDVEGSLLATVDRCGDLGKRVRDGRRVERLRTTVDLPNVIRESQGPGWALVGDAGLVMDPVTAQGIGNAFRDADRLSRAVGGSRDAGEEDRETTNRAGGAGRERRTRGRDWLPIFDATQRIARLRGPGAGERLLLKAVARDQRNTSQFLGVFAGTVPLPHYRRPGNLLRVLVSGLAGARSRTPREACRP